MSLVPHRRRPFVKTLGLALAMLGLSALVSAQLGNAGVIPANGTAGPAMGANTRGFQFVAAKPFTWAEAPQTQLTLNIPVGPGGGWLFLPGLGLQLRLVPSWSTDPTFEVLLWPPISGHPTKPESFLVQFPLFEKVAPADKALVIAFHPFGVSEKSPFSGSSLPFQCAQRGWVLLSPLGLSQANFANVESQLALDAVLALVRQFITFSKQRIYTVGFSMGGCNAVSWAMRHQDPSGLRAAGIIDHTGTMDLVENYNLGTPQLKTIMEGEFGGSPAAQAFNYDRVSPFRLAGTTVDANQARVSNVRHLPFYLHFNNGDPTSSLLLQTQALRNYLVAHGATVQLSTVNSGPVHSWSTLPMQDALDWIGQFTLPPAPDAIETFADAAKNYLYTEVRELSPQKVARYHVALEPVANRFEVTATRDIQKLAFDLSAMGLDPTQTLRFDASSADASSDTLILVGYPQAPQSVKLFGFFPPLAWSYDAATDELSVTPNASGSLAEVVIVPAP